MEDVAALSEQTAVLDGKAEAIAAVRSAQDAFNAASDAKIDAKTSKGASATSFRKPIITCINEKLVPYLSAMRDTDGYADFADKVQAEIAAVNAVAAKRGKKEKAAE